MKFVSPLTSDRLSVFGAHSVYRHEALTFDISGLVLSLLSLVLSRQSRDVKLSPARDVLDVCCIFQIDTLMSSGLSFSVFALCGFVHDPLQWRAHVSTVAVAGAMVCSFFVIRFGSQ